MARPPFEEPIVVTRPPQEEGASGGKEVPVPKFPSSPLISEAPKPSSQSKGGMLIKLIAGIGFAAAMLGIGAFVGVVVIWMGRIELTSRIPPGGTPLENRSASPDRGVSAEASRPSSPASPSAGGGEKHSKPSANPSVGLESPQGPLLDRSQILLEMEVLQMERSKAEEVLGQSAAGGLNASARKLIEAMMESVRPKPAPEPHVFPSSSASQESTPFPERTSPKQEGPTARENPPPRLQLSEKIRSGGKSPSEGGQRPGLSNGSESELPKDSAAEGTRSPLLEASKHTQAFRERWGIRAESLRPSGGSITNSRGDGEPSQTPPSDDSSRKSSKSESSRPERSVPEKSGSSVAVGGYSELPAFGKPSDTSRPKAGVADTGGLEELSASELAAGLETLQRQGVVQRIGSAKLALLHRWPSQIDLVHPELVDSGRAGSETRLDPQRISGGKLYCLAERASADLFTLELVAELPPSQSSDAGQKLKEAFSTKAESTSPSGRGAFSQQTGKHIFYVFPAQFCQAGRYHLFSSLPASGDGQSSALVLCVLVRGKVEPVRGALGQVPLSESELRERAVAQCRYLETLLQAKFPTSRIQVSLAAGKIFLHGQTISWREQEEILALVRRRAILQWKVHQLSPGNLLDVTAADQGDSAVVEMLRVPQVRLRVQMVELDFSAGGTNPVAKPDRAGSSATAGLSAESRRWLQTVSEAANGRQAVVVPAASAAQWEELQSRNLARIVWEHDWIGPSGRKETVPWKGAEGPVCPQRGQADVSRRPSAGQAGSTHADHGHKNTSAEQSPPDAVLLTNLSMFPSPAAAASRAWLVEIQAQCTDQGAIRLEVAPVMSERVVPEAAQQGGLLSQAHYWHIEALLQPDQWLLAPVADLTQPAAKSPSPHASAKMLLVSAEAVSEQSEGDEEVAARSTASVGGQPLSQASSPLPSPNKTPSLPIRKAQQAHYEESQPSPSASSLANQSVPLPRARSAETGPLPSPAPSERLQVLQEVLGRLFPDSQVQLRWEADRLIVEGQAANPAEASQILAVVRAEALPEQSANVLVENRLRVANTGPVQYLVRVRFVRVHGPTLRQAADKVKRDFPRLVPLAGLLLDLAERGGHLVLQPTSTAQLPELLAQAEGLDLVRIVAQPTFGILPGQPAEYLLPLTGANADLNPPATSRQQDQTPSLAARGSYYLLWHLNAQWTPEGRWQLEIIVEPGGSSAPTKEGSGRRLLAELEPGQTSAAAIPPEFYPGPGRLVVLTTPEIRNTPMAGGRNGPLTEGAGNAPLQGSIRPDGSIRSAGSEGLASPNANSAAKGAPSPISPSSPKVPVPEVSSSKLPTGGSPPRAVGRNSSFIGTSQATSQRKASTPMEPNSPMLPSGAGSQGPGPGSTVPEGSSQANSPGLSHGLLPKLGQLFRMPKEKSPSSAPGYTVAESPDPPSFSSPERTVPDAPQPDSSDTLIIPRVVRPHALR